MSAAAPALTITQLNTRLDKASRDFGVPIARVRRMLCTLVVSQMLPDAVAIKVGMGIKLRMGESDTRATRAQCPRPRALWARPRMHQTTWHSLRP